MTPSGVYDLLARFGLHASKVESVPSLSSSVFRIWIDGRSVFVKQIALQELIRLEWSETIGELLTRGGVKCNKPASLGDFGPYVNYGGGILAFYEPLEGKSLRAYDLNDRDRIRRIAELLARVHDILNCQEISDIPGRPTMWRDDNYPSRIVSARRGVEKARPFQYQDVMLQGLHLLEDTPSLPHRLTDVSQLSGLVHGDFWPGNLISMDDSFSEIALIDMENACLAPLLLDVAQFVDLAFTIRSQNKKVGIDLSAATIFAKHYGHEANVSGKELSRLPGLLIAARVCSIVWIAERHLACGSNPLDSLVANDLETIKLVRRMSSEWGDRLLSDGCLTS